MREDTKCSSPEFSYTEKKERYTEIAVQHLPVLGPKGEREDIIHMKSEYSYSEYYVKYRVGDNTVSTRLMSFWLH